MYYLKEHNFIHEDIGQLTCYKCKQLFSRKQTLELHLRWHDNEKLFQCTECGKIYKSPAGLKDHFIIRHGEGKPLQCNQCYKRFGGKEKLEKHMRVHSNIPPLTCNQCGKSFQRRNHLRGHLYVHKEGKLAHCYICDNNFSPKHIKTHIEKCRQRQNYSHEIIKSSEDLSEVEKRKPHEDDGVQENTISKNSEILIMSELFEDEIKQLKSQVDPKANDANETAGQSEAEDTLEEIDKPISRKTDNNTAMEKMLQRSLEETLENKNALFTHEQGYDPSLVGSYEDLMQYVSKVEGRYICCCGAFSHQCKMNMKNHVESIHFPGLFKWNCEICGYEAKTRNILGMHKYRKHTKKPPEALAQSKTLSIRPIYLGR